VGARRDGAASGAAAGLLAPSIGRLWGAVRAFFAASLQCYPAFLTPLQTDDPELRIIQGLVEVPAPQPGSQGDSRDVVVLKPADLARFEPGVNPERGGALHPADGAIDNVRLMAALRRALRGESGVRWVADDPAVAIDAISGSVRLESGAEVAAGTIVLAAGAWSPLIAGLPRSLPVSPLKGQMLAVASSALSHAVIGEDVYLVPRSGEIVIGATVERAGFDLGTTAEAIEGLRAAAVEIAPSLAMAPVIRQWAGTRPATPDMLPFLGRDPEAPNLIYACGHSKNGILLAPLTAIVVTRLVQQLPPGFDLTAFAPDRFGRVLSA
jgi:glycine oxidase